MLPGLMKSAVVRVWNPGGLRADPDTNENLQENDRPGQNPSLGRTSRNERLLWAFLAVWFVVGVLQSIFTNLDGEEAYYATFARHLAWGYFDHPPAMPLFVRLGMLIFPGDLGPRFMMVVLGTATLWVGSRLLKRKLIPVYIVTVCGLAMTQAGSFLVKPDVPLLFFATVFFYYYREYLRDGGRVAVLALSIAIAGMLLSKYHGILVVVFTVLSNPKLFARASFWFIVVLSCALALPHGIWLYSHDFATIRYHLGGRTDSGFSWSNVIEYVLMQPFVFGPAIGVLLLPAALVARTRDDFGRALKFNLVGILAFFFVASFAVHIHKHWTSIALVPMLTLGIPYIYERQKLLKVFLVLAVGTAVAFVPVRLYLAWDFLPEVLDRKVQIVHGWAEWAQDIRKIADGRNVVFLNDYESAGKYTYYTGETADSYNTFWYQHTEHDIWPIEDNFRGKPAIIVNGYLPQSKTVQARNRAEISYRFVNDFEAYSKVEIRPASGSLHCVANRAFDLPIVLVNHYGHPIVLKGQTELAPVVMYYFFKGQTTAAWGEGDVIAGNTLDDKLVRTIRVQPPAIPGDYKLRFVIRPGWLPPTDNGGMYGITVDAAARGFDSGAGQSVFDAPSPAR
jgi:Dolichyl-phosphate-mannose-protein mannosyltransferase